ncbi:TIM-barrel domain-containing protein, partial [Salmonella enterica]|uniref:TIM-barrel domain-containing protein n=1 Tax=Salmonella enterica TaxID=28901 RepID=UPI0011030854
EGEKRQMQWRDFQRDPGTCPEPKGRIRRLKAKGLKVCVWINPYIGQKSPVFQELKEKGYLLKRPDGSLWPVSDTRLRAHGTLG